VWWFECKYFEDLAKQRIKQKFVDNCLIAPKNFV
jgi:hypothetical protein